jgi:hypothetical protein
VDEAPGPVRVSPAPEHHAPPPYRPLSVLAVTALVAAFLPGLLALSGLWWLAAPGLILGALAWSLLADGRKRGRGLALVATILSLAIGVWSFVGNRVAADALERGLDPFVRALAAPDPDEKERAETARWVGPNGGADAPSVWRRRLAAAGVGSKLDRLEVGSVWLGTLATIIAVPRGVAEVEPPPKADPIAPGDAVWVRAHFAGGDVWLALLPEGEARGRVEATERLSELFKALAGLGGDRRLRDVRVFRSVD